MKKYFSIISNHTRKIVLILVVILGLALVLYPFVAQFYYDHLFSKEVTSFQEDIKTTIPSKENQK
ncbi:MAG: hypothetical protein RR649_06850, partial [Carnobacterium sp.]